MPAGAGPTPSAPAGRSARKAVGAEIGRLFEEHGRMVFALCAMLLRDQSEAEDALQQTFLSAHRSMLSGTSPDDPAAWLATIGRNECISRLRRRRPEMPLRESDHPAARDVAEVVGQRAEIAALSEALATLPPAQRQAVILRDFYGLSYREVSVALGVSGSAVESLLFRSRKRLQEALRPIHAASGLTALPVAVRAALVRAVPGFLNGLGATGAGAAGAGVSAKVLSLPAVAKFAALVAVAGVGVTVAEQTAPPTPHAKAVVVRTHRDPATTPLVVHVPTPSKTPEPTRTAPATFTLAAAQTPTTTARVTPVSATKAATTQGEASPHAVSTAASTTPARTRDTVTESAPATSTTARAAPLPAAAATPQPAPTTTPAIASPATTAAATTTTTTTTATATAPTTAPTTTSTTTDDDGGTETTTTATTSGSDDHLMEDETTDGSDDGGGPDGGGSTTTQTTTTDTTTTDGGSPGGSGSGDGRSGGR